MLLDDLDWRLQCGLKLTDCPEKLHTLLIFNVLWGWEVCQRRVKSGSEVGQ